MSDNGLIDWDAAALAVARNQVGPRLPAEELIASMGLTATEFASLIDDDLFKRKVRALAKELTENGSSFALKARVQAEELLKTHFKIATDKDTPPSVAIAAIGSVVRWAGFDKRPLDSDEVKDNSPKISISITLAAPKTTDAPGAVIDVTPSVTTLPDAPAGV